MQLTIENLVHNALAEDIGQEDLTTNTTVDPDLRCRARLVAKQDGVLSGIDVFKKVFDYLDSELDDWKALDDGTPFSSGDELATFTGHMRAVLTGERTALNFIQHLTGVASIASIYAKAVEELPVRVCDTRKTTPLMRELEKRAVSDGGAYNHRHTLFNGVLIKENHIVGAGGIEQAIAKAREGTHHLMRIEIEVTNLDELDRAVAAGADVIMLDNMSLKDMHTAVERCAGQKVVLEASGNMTLDRLRAVAETGVNVISIGALTHSAPAADLSLLIEHV